MLWSILQFEHQFRWLRCGMLWSRENINFPHASTLADAQLKHDVWATNYLSSTFKKGWEDNKYVSVRYSVRNPLRSRKFTSYVLYGKKLL